MVNKCSLWQRPVKDTNLRLLDDRHLQLQAELTGALLLALNLLDTKLSGAGRKIKSVIVAVVVAKAAAAGGKIQ